MATLNQFPAIGKGLIKSCPQSGIFDSLHPFCHTNSELSGHKIHQDPCTWGKNAPRNAWKQILFKFWAIVGHSVPLPPVTSELFPLRSSDHACCWDTLLKTLHQSCQEINGKCKCKQTSNEYRQTPPNTQCCILLEIRPLLYILFPTKQKIYIHYQLVYLPNIDSSISTAKLSPPSMYLWHD